MKPFSNNNTYSTTTGERLNRQQIETRIRKAKGLLIDQQLLHYGYNFCQSCGINQNAGIPLDCSHTVSVKECLETGKAELAFDVDNMRVLCRRCHNEHDKTFLG